MFRIIKDQNYQTTAAEIPQVRVLKVIDAPWFRIIDGTGAL